MAAAVIIKLPFAPPPAAPAPPPEEPKKKEYNGPSIAEIRAAYQREQAAALGPPKHGKRPSAFLQPRYSTRSTAPPPPPKPEPEPEPKQPLFAPAPPRPARARAADGARRPSQ